MKAHRLHSPSSSFLAEPHCMRQGKRVCWSWETGGGAELPGSVEGSRQQGRMAFCKAAMGRSQEHCEGLGRSRPHFLRGSRPIHRPRIWAAQHHVCLVLLGCFTGWTGKGPSLTLNKNSCDCEAIDLACTITSQFAIGVMAACSSWQPTITRRSLCK